MGAFTYKAKKGLDKIIDGTIIAENEDDALNKLVAQGLFPISVIRIEEKEARRKRVIKFAGSKKITSRDILQFSQKLGTLIRAKVELLASLKTLYEQTETLALKNIILELYNATKEGKTFSASLERFPSAFSPLFVNIVKAGEASGKLDSAL